MTRLQMIEARIKAATPGKCWVDALQSNGCEVQLFDRTYTVWLTRSKQTPVEQTERDAHLIAHAPSDLSALVSALRIAVRELTELSEGDAHSIAGQALAEIAKVVG